MDAIMLECDSKDYDIITQAIDLIPNSREGMTCEIGIRRGGGSKFIIDALAKKEFKTKVHIGIDPYGNIEYLSRDGRAPSRYDYTNEMRDQTLGQLYSYATSKNVNFVFINLEDSEFFKRYCEGVPVYQMYKQIMTEYSFVHFDGPHQYQPVYDEFIWFNERMKAGATIVFDDIGHYDHDKLEQVILNDWNLIRKTTRKASYQKK